MATRLLIVDDEDSITFALSRYFEQLGYTVRTASDREQAELILRQEIIDIVIADLRLSGSEAMDGLELVRFIRSRFIKAQVVILTAFGSAEVKAAAQGLNVDAFMDKPTPLAEIARVIAGFAKHSTLGVPTLPVYLEKK